MIGGGHVHLTTTSWQRLGGNTSEEFSLTRLGVGASNNFREDTARGQGGGGRQEEETQMKSEEKKKTGKVM